MNNGIDLKCLDPQQRRIQARWDYTGNADILHGTKTMNNSTIIDQQNADQIGK